MVVLFASKSEIQNTIFYGIIQDFEIVASRLVLNKVLGGEFNRYCRKSFYRPSYISDEGRWELKKLGLGYI